MELSNEDMTHHIKSQVPDHTLPMAEWKLYAGQYLPIVRRRVADMDAALKMGVKMDDRELRDYNRLTHIQSKLDTLARCMPDMWTVEPSQYGFKFDPVWPGFYARSLFQDIKRVILMSATIRPKTLSLLGLKAADYTFKEYPSPFNPNDSPIYHVPTARIWHGSTADELNAMYSRIDQILRDRLDRKGLIHSVSYKRALEIDHASEYRRYMITHKRGGPPTSRVIDDFKKAGAPSYLVSPSVVAGQDFAGCTAPGTRILRDDLIWVNAGDLKVGDRLVGFDEHTLPGRRTKTWKTSVVTCAERIVKQSSRLTLEDGREIICSDDHMWLGRSRGVAAWVSMRYLNAGPKQFTKLCDVMDLWEPQADWDHGYLAGAFDGEGCYLDDFNTWRGSALDMTCAQLNMAQTENAMFFEVQRLLNLHNYGYRIHTNRKKFKPHWKTRHNIHISQRRDMFRFFGECRPQRLLPKFHIDRMGSVNSKPVNVVRREHIGPHELVLLSTSTKTYIAEGIASHNSLCEINIIPKLSVPDQRSAVMKERLKRDPEYADYLTVQDLVQACGRGNRFIGDRCQSIITDDSIRRYLWKCRHQFPKYFFDFFRTSGTIPKPLAKMPTSKLSKRSK